MRFPYITSKLFQFDFHSASRSEEGACISSLSHTISKLVIILTINLTNTNSPYCKSWEFNNYWLKLAYLSPQEHTVFLVWLNFSAITLGKVFVCLNVKFMTTIILWWDIL